MTPAPGQEAYEALVQTHGARVYRAALSVTRCPEDAEDATADVFLRVLSGRLDPASAVDPGALLAASGARMALQHRRGAGRRRQREDLHAMDQDRSTPGPEQALGAREQRALVRRELELLPEEVRLPVSLRFEAELSYGDIGTLLGCAEPTAHDRVRRGLDRLRRALAGLGLVAICASLEEQLAALQRPTPTGLEARLLELSAAGTIAAGSAAGGVTALLGFAAAACLAWAVPQLARSSEHGPAPVVPAVSPVSLAAAPEGAAGDDLRRSIQPWVSSGQHPAPEVPRGFVEGRVVDAAAQPVAGATVVVASAEREGKRLAYGVEGTTAADGTFRLPVDVVGEGRNVHVRVRQLGYVAVQAPLARVTAERTTDLGSLVLDLPDVDAAGEYTLHVRLVTPTGGPAPPVELRVDHLVRHPVTHTGDWADWLRAGLVMREADSASLASEGTGTLTGTRVGAKLLRVAPRGGAWAMADVPVTIVTGVNEVVVALRLARALEGTLRTTDGGVPDRLQGTLRWVSDTSVWIDVPIDAEGRFRVAGLAPDAYELWLRPIGNAPWSAVSQQVVPGEEPVALVIKRAADPRDVGDHMAELHGRLVDPAGQPVVWRALQVEDWWFDPSVAGDWERDVLPNHLVAPPVQRMDAWGNGADPYAPPPPSAELHQTGLRSGRHVYYLSVPGYALDVAGPYELAEGELRSGIEVGLRAPATVDVTVLDPAGELLDGAAVLITGTGPYSDGVVEARDAEYLAIDGRGYFHANRMVRAERGHALIEDLPAGRNLRIAVVHPALAPGTSAELVLRGGERRDVTVQLQRQR